MKGRNENEGTCARRTEEIEGRKGREEKEVKITNIWKEDRGKGGSMKERK